MVVPIYVGNVGVVIRLTVYEDGAAKDISAATSKSIKIRKPDGTTLTRNATFSGTGTDGRVYCVTSTDDFDTPGLYVARVYFVLGGFTGHTTGYTIPVEAA